MTVLVNPYRFAVPAAITSLLDLTPLRWYRADGASKVLEAISGSDVAEDGDGVERWMDESGNAGHADQATSGKRPTLQTNEINGLPVIRFDGTDDVLAGTTPATSQPLTIVGVFKANPDAVARTQVMWMVGAQNALIRISSSNKWQSKFDDGTASTSPVVVVVVLDGASSKFRVNGAETTGSGGTSTSVTNVFLGGQNATPSNPYNADIGEVALFSRALNSVEIVQAETHLTSKWAL